MYDRFCWRRELCVAAVQLSGQHQSTAAAALMQVLEIYILLFCLVCWLFPILRKLYQKVCCIYKCLPFFFRKAFPKFCYYCGRSVSVRLTPCYRCYKVFYCSKPCRLKAWDALHKKECFRVKAGTQGCGTSHQRYQRTTIEYTVYEMLLFIWVLFF